MLYLLAAAWRRPAQTTSRPRRGSRGRPAALAAALLLWSGAPSAEVRVDGERLLVDGRPFQVRGAAGTDRLAELKLLGANTVRTYGEDPGPVLDAAAAVGLKVIAGFWLEHPRRGFDYADRRQVEAQLERLAGTVERYRHHPALLLWGLGNEVEAELADPAAVWPAIEEAARLVKRLDPAHPAMAVLAETGEDKVRRLAAAAPSIDVLGVNSYGDALPSLPGRVRAQGWRGPLLVTELGPLGQWQAGRTAWGAAIEPSSTEKARLLARHLAPLERATAGQIVFFWGQKQEVTPTWHGLFLAEGEWTQPLEAMAAAWQGRTPGGNRAPRIDAFALSPDARQASLSAQDPDGDRLAVAWRILAESTRLGVAGDAEPVPADHSAALAAAGAEGARIGALPAGRYRLFVTVRDGRGAAAVANLPFEVR